MSIVKLDGLFEEKQTDKKTTRNVELLTKSRATETPD